MPRPTVDVLAGWPLHDASIEIGAQRLDLYLIDQDFVVDRLVEENADLEQRNPYFGIVWPAAIALARDLDRRDDLAATTVLDIGCGPGLLGIVAARKGARVTFLDLMKEGVALAERNAARSGVPGEFLCADLRDDAVLARQFDFIVASDVLYERPLVNAVFAALDRSLPPHGIALLSDPNRPTAHEFAHTARRRGYEVEEVRTTVSDEGKDVPIRMFQIRRGSAAGGHPRSR
jgi:2-polyprenyl-3-methyl-5-hydroxy-6-metoxy-1,4-benzoquinol methylase